MTPDPAMSPAFEMRIHRNQPRTIYMHSPAYPAGEAVATCSLTWVAEAFVKLWNEARSNENREKAGDKIIVDLLDGGQIIMEGQQ